MVFDAPFDKLRERTVAELVEAPSGYWQLSHCSSSIGSTGTLYPSTAYSSFIRNLPSG